MATTNKTRASARGFDLLLPRLGREGEGLTFAAGNFVRRTGTVPAQLAAVKLSGSPLGVHASAKDGTGSLCGLPLTANGKSVPEVKASGTAAKVAPSVTCRFCQARLVGAGVLDPKAEGVSAYAADYGMRDAESELAAIEARASKASKTTTRKTSKTSKRVTATA